MPHGKHNFFQHLDVTFAFKIICHQVAVSLIRELRLRKSEGTKKTIDRLLECQSFLLFLFQGRGREKLRPRVSVSACIKDVTKEVRRIEMEKSDG